MKSALFQKNDVTQDESFQKGPFKRDLQALLALSEQQLNRLPELMKAIIPIKNQKEREKAREAAAKELANIGVEHRGLEHRGPRTSGSNQSLTVNGFMSGRSPWQTEYRRILGQRPYLRLFRFPA